MHDDLAKPPQHSLAMKPLGSRPIVISALLLLPLIAGGSLLSPLAAPTLVVAAAAGLVIVAFPFTGLALIVFFAQLDELLRMFVQGLPGMKLLTAATLAGALLQKAKSRPTFQVKEQTLHFAAMFAIAVLLSTLFSKYPDIARDYSTRLIGLVILLYLIVFLITTRWHLQILFLCIVASTVVSGIFVLYDNLSGEKLLETARYADLTRSAGASNYDPTTTATMLMAGSALAVMLALGSRKWRFAAGIAAMIGISAMLFTFARSSALVFGAGLVWVLFKYRKHRLFPLGLVVFLGVAAVGVSFAPETLVERFASLVGAGGPDPTLSRRWGYQLIGLDLFTHHPLFGIGVGTFPHYYIEFDYRWMPGRELEPRRLHNMYLSIAVEAGLLGIAVFAGMIACALIRGFRALQGPAAGLERTYVEASLFAFVLLLTVNLTLPGDINKYVWIFMGLTVAAARLCTAPVGSGIQTRNAAETVARRRGSPA